MSDPNRRRMLEVVRKTWIDGYLKHSLDNVVRVELGLEERPDAISRPWDLIVQQPDRPSQPLPPGQAMGAIFDELGQAARDGAEEVVSCIDKLIRGEPALV